EWGHLLFRGRDDKSCCLDRSVNRNFQKWCLVAEAHWPMKPLGLANHIVTHPPEWVEDLFHHERRYISIDHWDSTQHRKLIGRSCSTHLSLIQIDLGVIHRLSDQTSAPVRQY